MIWGETQIDNAPAYPPHLLFAPKYLAYVNFGVHAVLTVGAFVVVTAVMGPAGKVYSLGALFAGVFTAALVHVFLAVRYRRDHHWGNLVISRLMPADHSRSPNVVGGMVHCRRFKGQKKAGLGGRAEITYSP